MAEELTYVIVTPYSIAKSRTGGILARIMARATSELVAARMFAPSKELAEEFADLITIEGGASENPGVRQLIQDYIRKNFAPDPKYNRGRRVMVLIFKGENAAQHMREEVVGHITNPSLTGETIRDTYADYVKNEDGSIQYFEPAVLTSPLTAETGNKLKKWAKYSDLDGGVLDNLMRFKDHDSVEKTLVLVKPDNFEHPSARLGNIIDLFSRSGLRIIGIKVIRMGVQQAKEFYGPVKEVFLDKLRSKVEHKVQNGILNNFDFAVPQEKIDSFVDELNPLNAEYEFNKIIKFMTGLDPSELNDPSQLQDKGIKTCFALIYQGPKAISQIREILGTTDPSKAKPATVRKEFGSNVMVNTAHASDSTESFLREIAVLNIANNDFKEVIETFYK